MGWRDNIVPNPADLTGLTGLTGWKANTVPATGNVMPDLTPDPKSLPGIMLSLRQGFSPDDDQFAEFLETRGFQNIGKQKNGSWLVQGPDQEIYDLYSRDDILLRNFPELLATGLSAGAGLLASGALRGPGIIRWLAKIAATSGIEGSLNAGLEAARQATGISMGVGDNLNEGKIDMAGKAGLVAGALPGALGATLKGAGWLGKRVSGLGDDLASAVRIAPELLDRSSREAIEASERSFNRKLSDQSEKLIGDTARDKAQSLARASESGISYSPKDLLDLLEDAQSRVSRPLGGADPLAGIKAELQGMAEKTVRLPLLDMRGQPMVQAIPESVVDPKTVAATKSALQDMGALSPLEKSTFKEGTSREGGRAMRSAEDMALDIEGQIARDRLASINRLRENYPTLRKGMEGNPERMSKDQLFKPSIDQAMEESLKELDRLGSGLGIDPMLPDYQNIMLRKRIGQSNQLRSSETGASLFGPLVGSAIGSVFGPAGTGAGAVVGSAVQSPAANLQLQKFLGYLDKLGVKKGARLGSGARDAILMEMIEGD